MAMLSVSLSAGDGSYGSPLGLSFLIGKMEGELGSAELC